MDRHSWIDRTCAGMSNRHASHSTRTRVIALICAAIVIGLACPARADAGRDAAVRGNNFFKQGQYQEAVLAYELAVSKGFEPTTVIYNLARAQAEVGELDDAEANFRRVVSDPMAGVVAAAARFNLGSIDYQRARAIVETKPADAIGLLQRAERHFRDVVGAEAGDAAAARNIEVVMREIKRIQDRLDKQKQEQSTDGTELQSSQGDQKKNDPSNQQKSAEQKQNQPGEKPEDQPNDSEAGNDHPDQPKESESTSGEQSKPSDSTQDQRDRGTASTPERFADLAGQQSELAKQSQRLADDRAKSQQGAAGSPSQQEMQRRAQDLQRRQDELSKRTQEVIESMEQEREKETPVAGASKNEESKPDLAKPDAAAAARARERQEAASKKLGKEDTGAAAEEQRAAARELAAAAGLAGTPETDSTSSSSNEAANAASIDAARILDKEKREAAQRLMRLLRARTGKPAAGGKDW